MKNEASIVIQSDDVAPLGLKLTFVKNAEQLSLFSYDDDTRQPRGLAFLRLEYLGIDRKFDFDLSNQILDRRQLRMFGPLPFSQSKANYISTKGFDYDFLAHLWDGITLTPKEDDVIAMLQILEPDVERISFQSRKTANSGILIKRRGHNGPLPLGSLGDGMHRILALASALANSENGYLFVDEIDTGLHYRTITDLWNLVFKTAERLNVQVFATTHSSDCIESFNEALAMQADPHAGKLFRLERRHQTIAAVPYDNEALDIATQQEIEVR